MTKKLIWNSIRGGFSGVEEAPLEQPSPKSKSLALPSRAFEIGDIVRFEGDDGEGFTPCQIVGYVIENYSHCGPVWYYYVRNSFNVSTYNQSGYEAEALVKVTDLPADMAWYLDGVLPYAAVAEEGVTE